jgi:hypothetical protein
MMVAGSLIVMPSARSCSGHSNAVSTPPTNASFSRPLTKLASACAENSRLAPAIGEMRLSLGASESVVHTSRCCTTLPITAASASSRNGMASAESTSMPSFLDSQISAGPSMLRSCALAMRPRIVAVNRSPMPPENATITKVAPAMMNQVLTSWLLTTSPRLSASSNRFWVGSSVR